MSASATRTSGSFAARRDGSDAPLSELSLSFVPLAFVAEWTRCSETADFVGRFFSHDFSDRELAGNVLSTIMNELVENAVKFSNDKSLEARVVVREYESSITISTENDATSEQAASFAATIARLVEGEPEAMFAEQIANPPETGGAGIGLIMLRKDYDATVGARMTQLDAASVRVVVEVTIANQELGPP
jgi:hypothetical protein